MNLSYYEVNVPMRNGFLLNEHPEMARQWDLLPNKRTSLARVGPGATGSAKGHVWQAKVYSRVSTPKAVDGDREDRLPSRM
ncbi:hypothetical protein ACFVW1_20925 [Streptomyces olivochromogenes]|uniref:hypothetical protein n=1 Tax=Streptomyces olivochromogenes TaxID=1963 RepID=UPI0036DA6042